MNHNAPRVYFLSRSITYILQILITIKNHITTSERAVSGEKVHG